MPIIRERTQATRDAVDATPWIEDCEEAVHPGQRDALLRIVGTIDGEHVDTYIPRDPSGVQASIDCFELEDGPLITTRQVDGDLAVIEEIPHIEAVEIVGTEWGSRPSIRFIMPGAGTVDIEVGAHADLGSFLARTLRNRRQDAEGRNLSRLGAMTLALAARDAADLDRIVDTVFTGAAGDFRGVRYETDSQGRITTSYDHQAVQMRSDGIEIADLPETIRAGIVGKQRRRLDQVVEVPGFDDLEVVGISHRAMSSRMSRRNWVRIDVRDADGARFEQLEIEEARTAAQETLRRRA
jgi:hypothetical protein